MWLGVQSILGVRKITTCIKYILFNIPVGSWEAPHSQTHRHLYQATHEQSLSGILSTTNSLMSVKANFAA